MDSKLRMTPEMLRAFAKTMEDHGLKKVSFDGVELVRDTGEDLKATEHVFRSIDQALEGSRIGAFEGDPREADMAYPGGLAPVFPEDET